ncbi:unnamed protein product [Chironomus riparius]|uniref:Ionotropic receptor n=1 Tax=Chironomus riparius TaxID=315576 RepID=A0A9N9S811_9DIPT|nr:unnamed protein product [Chironomus riparius]
MSNYICKVSKDVIKAKNHNQDVLIVNLGGKMWLSTVNDIARCVGHENAVLVNDFKKPLTEKTLRKANLIIMFAESKMINLNQLVTTHHFGTAWHQKAKILWIVPATASLNQRLSIVSTFMHFGFLDVAVVFEKPFGIQVEVLTSMTRHFSVYTNEFNHSLVFPDKLKSMNRFMYSIIVYDQPPMVRIVNETVYSPLVYFLLAVAHVQNARLSLMIINDYHLMEKFWYDRKMDLTLNTGVLINAPEPKLQTYVQNGYCALVPLPPKVPVFQSIFIEPFDGLTWLFLLVTVACSVAVWWMFRGRGAVDSPWLLAYGMFVIFIGQGVNFSRKNRLVLTFLLELIIVMVWILCNAYEGVITSFMIQPIHEYRLETFDDLVASHYEIMTDGAFASKISKSEAYKVLKPRLNTSGQQLGIQFGYEIKRQHYVFIIKCDRAEMWIDLHLGQTEKKVSDFYYLMQQKFLLYFEQLEASYMNPFLDRFQYFMDLSFQAGLMQMWKLLAFENSKMTRTIKSSIEAAYLKLEDLTQVFSILVVGCVMSTILFLFEIFFHDILKELKLANLARKLRNRVHQMALKKKKQSKNPKYQKGALYYIVHRHKRVKRLKARKMKVRSIYVQPRFPLD